MTLKSGRRVVVTGVGPVSSIGIGKEAFWKGLAEGRNGIGPITQFDASQYSSQIAGEIRDFNPKDYIDGKFTKRSDRFVHFALTASRFAVEDAGLIDGNYIPERSGVVVGSGIGGGQTIQSTHKLLLEKGPGRVSPFFVPIVLANMAASNVSMAHNFKGPIDSPCTACATGTNAIGQAFRLIKYGDADVMMAGGAEASITPLAFSGFCAARALSTRNDDPAHASRPFDRDRDGFVMGEGAGILVLEDLEHARRRGARIYCEVAGYGMSADAHHLTAPPENGEGAVRAIKAALAEAGLSAKDIDYVNAHGTSTPLNDKTECAALKAVLGERLAKVPVSSTKSMIGHLLSAAGGMEAAATVLTMANNFIPPTINMENQDPDCPIDCVPNTGRPHQIQAALSESFGFGGINAVLLFRRLEN